MWQDAPVIRNRWYHPHASKIGRIAFVLAVLIGFGVKFGWTAAPTPELTFAFHRVNAPGYIDQTLDISNLSTNGIVPVLKIVAVDASGAVLPGITVTTAYGSDRGNIVIPARETVNDILAFAGSNAANVTDVHVVITSQTSDSDRPMQAQYVTAQAVDASGGPTSKFRTVRGRRVDESEPVDIKVGVVCIQWDQPPSGQPQQAVAVIPLGVTMVPASGSTTIPMSGSDASGCGSIKVYFAPA